MCRDMIYQIQNTEGKKLLNPQLLMIDYFTLQTIKPNILSSKLSKPDQITLQQLMVDYFTPKL